MANEYTLDDYNELAYEFAIRNPRVIELLKSIPLTDEIAKELLEYGIDIYVVDEEIEYDEDNISQIGMIYNKRISLDELYLDYPHLGDNLKSNSWTYKENKKIIHPKSKSMSWREEDRVDAFRRIDKIFIKKANHLNRLMNGDIFQYYDQYILTDRKYKVAKRNKDDVDTINTFIKKNNYLNLIPKNASRFQKRNIAKDIERGRYH